MPLYKRVYPEWYEKTWNPNAIETVKKKHETFDAEEDKSEEEETMQIDP